MAVEGGAETDLPRTGHNRGAPILPEPTKPQGLPVSFPAPRDIREQVRQAIDIAELVGSYLQLQRRGRIYLAICPWHDDSRPSLQVNPERQTWKCWVCGDGGDIFNFVMKREGVDFRQALELLADRAGIAWQPAAGPAPAEGSAANKRTQYAAMTWAEQQYHECLLSSRDAEPARRYLEQRGITVDSMRRYRLGFAPNNWQWLVDRARSSAYSLDVLKGVGLTGISQNTGKPYDLFRGRVMFPIRDTQGRPIAFGGRVLPEWADDRTAKYVNSPETRLFSKSEHLYGIDLARDQLTKARQAWVMEGYTDVVMAAQYGLQAAVAVLGTALGPTHLRILRRYCDSVVLILDGDEAGQKRTNEVLELFVTQQLDLRIVTLPDGLDPCDFLRARGAAAFQAMVDQSVDALEHKCQIATRGIDPRRDTHKAHQALEEILRTIAKAPRLQNDTTNDVQLRQEQILARLARDFGVELAQLRERLISLRRTQGKRSVKKDTTSEPASSWTCQMLEARERELFEAMIRFPEIVALALEQVPRDELTTSIARELLALYEQLSRAGGEVSFARLITEVDDPRYKNLLVELDDAAQGKRVADPDLHLRDIVTAFRRRAHERRSGEAVATLQQKSLNEHQKMQLLAEVIEAQRMRQGIDAPTDG